MNSRTRRKRAILRERYREGSYPELNNVTGYDMYLQALYHMQSVNAQVSPLS